MSIEKFNPVGLELAEDVLSPHRLDPEDGKCMTLAFAGEELTQKLVSSLRKSGIDKLSIRIFPALPVNVFELSDEEFAEWYDDALDRIEDEW